MVEKWDWLADKMAECLETDEVDVMAVLMVAYKAES